MSFRRFLATLLSFVMLFQAMPMQVLSEDAAPGMLLSNVVEGVTYHKVTFTDGESVVATQYVADGSSVKFPQSPEKTGYTFSGWYLDADNDGKADEGSTALTSSTKIQEDSNFVSVFAPISEYKVIVHYLIGDTNIQVAESVSRYYTSEDIETDGVIDTIVSPATFEQGLDDGSVRLLYPEQSVIKVTKDLLAEAVVIQGETVPTKEITVGYYVSNASYTIMYVTGAGSDRPPG